MVGGSGPMRGTNDSFYFAQNTNFTIPETRAVNDLHTTYILNMQGNFSGREQGTSVIPG